MLGLRGEPERGKSLEMGGGEKPTAQHGVESHGDFLLPHIRRLRSTVKTYQLFHSLVFWGYPGRSGCHVASTELRDLNDYPVSHRPELPTPPTNP